MKRLLLAVPVVLALAVPATAAAPSPYERAQTLDARVTALVPKAQAVVTELQAVKAEADALVTATKPAEEPPPKGEEQTTWGAAGAPILPDAQAAARVIHKPEIRAAINAAPRSELGGASYNTYRPTDAELSAYYAAKNQYGELQTTWNSNYTHVTGRPGLTNPSTDDLIQWAAAKWSIPADWLRAEYVHESWWRQNTQGDEATETQACWERYPPQARKANLKVNESMGITGVKWRCDGSVGAGTEPLRWESTAFNIDQQAATVRYYYDGKCGWCTSGYGPGQQWASIGAWFSPYPWNNSGAVSYQQTVQKYLTERFWTTSAFING